LTTTLRVLRTYFPGVFNMAISINDINNAHITNASKNKQAADTDNNSAPTSANKDSNSATDTITFTDSAKLIQRLESQLEALPVVDSERVAHVRENINSGNHVISAERIAEKFSRYESLLEAAS